MKKPYKPVPSIASAIDAAMNNPEKVLGHVEITKVIREHMPLIQSDEYGPTIGNQIDAMLIETAKAGDELQSFKLEFEPEKWAKMAADFTKQDEPYSN